MLRGLRAVSAGYGFFCGAYMPIASLGAGMQKLLGLLPGTYGTSLVRNHALRGALQAVADTGAPAEVIDKIKDSVDCNLYFFGDKVSFAAMYLVIILSILVFVGLFVLVSYLLSRKTVIKRKQK